MSQTQRCKRSGKMCNAHHNAESNGDPTKTKTIRETYGSRLRGQLAKLNAVIRSGIIERDVFGLRGDNTPFDNQPSDPDPPPVFDFPRDDRKVDSFMDWLERQEQQGVLEVISRNDNPYIRSGYQRGLQNATRELQEQGVEVDTTDVEDIFNLGVHQDAAQALYTRNFRELRGITDVMDQQISRELADGFSQGENPTKISRRVTDRVNKIGKTRASTLAQTEVIRAHSEATLNRYERMGVETVTIRAEWLTAGDSRVCPICNSLEGKSWTIEEARSATFRYSAGANEPSSLSGRYPVQPPAHPNCRCSFIPQVV